MLINHCDLVGSGVLDLFAGSGSFGIEAISRGAKHVTFVEKRQQARNTITSNVKTLGFSGQSTVMAGTVPECLARLPQVGVAFCDPPYALDVWEVILEKLPADILVGHAESTIQLTDSWEEIRRRTYGRSQIVIARRNHHPVDLPKET